jgi:hypothetical protein
MNNYTPFVALWLAAVFLSSKSSSVQAQTFQPCADAPAAGEFGPTQTIYQNLCNGDPTIVATFTQFCALIDSTGFESFKTLLTSTTQFSTVFAPIDSAFTPPLPILTEELKRLIELHIVGDPLTLDSLICDETISTINFLGDGPQLQKTKCITGGQPFQIGGGNKGKENWPQIGSTSATRVFPSTEFTDPITPFNTDAVDPTLLFTGSNVVSCNGIIQVVDKLLRPATESRSRSKSGKSMKGSKGSDDFHRELETDNDNDNKRSSDSLQRRKRRLEALLEPNGNIEQLN